MIYITIRHITAVNVIIKQGGVKMFVKVGEFKKAEISCLRLVDNYAHKIKEVRAISRRRYNIINEGLNLVDVTSGVIVVGLNSAAHVAVMEVVAATEVLVYYIETGKIESMSLAQYLKNAEFLNILYDIDQYCEDVGVVVGEEHRHVEQMYASFLPNCSGAEANDTVLRRLDKAFLASGYGTVDCGGRSYALCPDNAGILRMTLLDDVMREGLKPYVVVKGTEELTVNKQTVSNNIIDMSDIDMSCTKRLYLPDYVTSVTNINHGRELCVGLRGVLFNMTENSVITVEDLGGVVTLQ